MPSLTLAYRMPDWPVVRAEAVREDILDEELGLSPV